MPKKAGTTRWRKQRRKEYLEKKKYRYYIFCEGEQTEPLYFEGFKRMIEDNPIYKDMVLIEIEPCAVETMRVIGMAERYVRKNGIDRGQIWCVYDKDSFLAKDFNGVAERVDKLNLEKPELQYHAAWSNECIEFWFILHFAYSLHKLSFANLVYLLTNSVFSAVYLSLSCSYSFHKFNFKFSYAFAISICSFK